MKSTLLKLLASMAIAVGLVSAQQVLAADHSVASHKLVLQLSSADPGTANLVLNNAVNVKKAWGDDVDVAVVAYGPGLHMLIDSKKNKLAKRVSGLAAQGVTFDACGNTMKKVAKKTGKMPVLIKGVKVVPGGLIEIISLQEKGWSYVRP